MASMTQARYQSGLGLVTAIFLLVVLAALGTAMINMATMGSQASALDVQGARAYQAARAGAEYAIYRARVDDSCADTAFDLTAEGINNFRVVVTCTPVTLPAPNGNIQRFVVRSVGCSPKSNATCADSTDADFVRRTIEVRFGR
jgi:MSHA biogenesis protein MshP